MFSRFLAFSTEEIETEDGDAGVGIGIGLGSVFLVILLQFTGAKMVLGAWQIIWVKEQSPNVRVVKDFICLELWSELLLTKSTWA